MSKTKIEPKNKKRAGSKIKISLSDGKGDSGYFCFSLASILSVA